MDRDTIHYTSNSDTYVNFVSQGNNVYLIQLNSDKTKYLTATGTASGSNVVWQARNTSSAAQKWKISKLSDLNISNLKIFQTYTSPGKSADGSVAPDMTYNDKTKSQLLSLSPVLSDEASIFDIYSEKRADIYYMICRPPSSQSEIIDLIEDHFTATKLDDLFIRTQTLIDKLITSDGLTRKFDGILYLHFIHPSDILPIGIFPKNIYDPELNVSEQEIVTLTVTSTASGYALEYYWNSNYC